WARVLAMMPLLVLILLCAGVIRDTVTALSAADQAGNDASHALAIVTTVLVFGVVTLALGLLFIRWRRGKEETRYYDALSWQEWCERAGFATTAPAMQKLVGQKYSLAGLIDPYWLPVAALVGMLLCRLVGVAATPSDMASHIPTMTLPIIMFALALWLCFFGWLSLLEVRQAIPWVGLLIVLIGALGLLGLTDNHLVWPPITDAATAERGTLRMLGFTALLGLLLVGLYMWVMHVVKDMSGRIAGLTAAGRPRTLALWAPPPVLLLLMVGVIALADHDASSREPDPSAREATRPDLDQALARWLTSLCSAKADAKDCDRQGFGSDDDHEVYFVSTEGGGIRAAAWTALALQHFASTVPQFQARTFSISGVSGGAIGAAAFRACNVGKSTDDAEGCVKRFAQTDLLAPLLAAWMFEDALARVVPTRWCTTPACGFLSRGAWFEQTMESALPAFRAGLTASPPATHRPYLFLNSTWVESGEPAIASDMRIEWERFRGAKDQLDISGHDLPLGTAAHNAARFPYVNAIGALKTGKQRCNLRAAEPPASVPKAVPAAADDPQAVCGHLADGGYFDNSGGQATLDVLHGLARCLEVRPGDSDAAMFAACLDIGDAKRVWLRAHLLPRVLMIRNSASPAAARAKVCFDVSRPTAEDVDFAPVKGCDALSNAGNYEPQRPICRPRSSLFVDFTGPAVTVLNVSGIGANGQLAEARQTQAVQTLRVSLGASAPLHAASAATAIDLLPDGVRYPLGWHLSPAAVDGMARQAGACKLSRPASAASQPGSASLTQIRSGAIASKPSRSNASASASSS
ncbi:MAG TPA: hypothetical protein VKI18_13510, partial [Albitalea sp.]|nr:hypothetical protein [Albitalea sp.]